MERKNTVIPAFILGILSPLAFLLSFFYSEIDIGTYTEQFFPLLIGVVAGVLAILSLNAKTAYGKSGMGTAAFILGIIGTSLCGLWFIYLLNELDHYRYFW